MTLTDEQITLIVEQLRCPAHHVTYDCYDYPEIDRPCRINEARMLRAATAIEQLRYAVGTAKATAAGQGAGVTGATKERRSPDAAAAMAKDASSWRELDRLNLLVNWALSTNDHGELSRAVESVAAMAAYWHRALTGQGAATTARAFGKIERPGAGPRETAPRDDAQGETETPIVPSAIGVAPATHVEADAALRRLWADAVGTPGYDEQGWISLERGLHAECGCAIGKILRHRERGRAG